MTGVRVRGRQHRHGPGGRPAEALEKRLVRRDLDVDDLAEEPGQDGQRAAVSGRGGRERYRPRVLAQVPEVLLEVEPERRVRQRAGAYLRHHRVRHGGGPAVGTAGLEPLRLADHGRRPDIRA